MIGSRTFSPSPLGNSRILELVRAEYWGRRQFITCGGHQLYHSPFMLCLLSPGLHHPSHGCCFAGEPRDTLPGVGSIAQGRGILPPCPKLGCFSGALVCGTPPPHFPLFLADHSHLSCPKALPITTVFFSGLAQCLPMEPSPPIFSPTL